MAETHPAGRQFLQVTKQVKLIVVVVIIIIIVSGACLNPEVHREAVLYGVTETGLLFDDMHYPSIFRCMYSRGIESLSLRPLACLDYGSESRRGYGCLSWLLCFVR